jgi:hypothetical protein
MHHNIKQLAMLAGLAYKLDPVPISIDENGVHTFNESHVYDTFDLEKFANLIVEECVHTCWTVSELESKGFVVSECVKRIRKNFGVEV